MNKVTYLDSLDIEEFNLFRKHNNKHERKGRHIDACMIDDPSLSDTDRQAKLKTNLINLRNDTVLQKTHMAEYFSPDNKDLKDDILADTVKKTEVTTDGQC